MKTYDVFVVGASTTGCWFAYQMAKQGFKVLVIEKMNLIMFQGNMMFFIWEKQIWKGLTL